MDPFELVEDISRHRVLAEWLLVLELLLVMACVGWAVALA